MRRAVVAVSALGVLGAAPAAQGATIGLEPAKPCYLAGETATLRGGGFTPGGGVNISLDSAALGSLAGDPAGNISGPLTFGRVRGGVRTSTLTGTDVSNPALTASTQINIAETNVTVRFGGGSPTRRRLVRATGFLTGERLYSHAVRRGYRRTVQVGRLAAPCGTIARRIRVFSRGAPVGRYRVQFDTSRRYSRNTPGRVIYSVTVFRKLRRSSASSAGLVERWTPLGAAR